MYAKIREQVRKSRQWQLFSETIKIKRIATSQNTGLYPKLEIHRISLPGTNSVFRSKPVSNRLNASFMLCLWFTELQGTCISIPTRHSQIRITCRGYGQIWLLLGGETAEQHGINLTTHSMHFSLFFLAWTFRSCYIHRQSETTFIEIYVFQNIFVKMEMKSQVGSTTECCMRTLILF